VFKALPGVNLIAKEIPSMSNEDDFEEGLKQILSNETSRNSSPGDRKKTYPRPPDPPASQPQAKPSGNNFIETLIRIAAALIALGLLAMFALQLFQR